MTNDPSPFFDPEIDRAFQWFLSFLPDGEWDARKSAIEQHLENLFQIRTGAPDLTAFHRLVGADDRMGWYLYLVDTSQHEPHRTEVNQAARILPVFKKLGQDLDDLEKITGIQPQAEKVLGASKGQPDSVLFEMLAALLWLKNGWRDVSFIPPSPTEKRPDIRAATGSDEWFIETKRLSTNSGYSQAEREKWLRMWRRLKKCLIDNRYPFILDITFHVELVDLDDDFVLNQLESKLRFVCGPCDLISNDTWDVSVKLVDFDRIRRHFEDNYAKLYSRQLQQLLGGSWDRKRGFTFVMESSNVRNGGETGINQYVERISWAAAAYWQCDADRANEGKARDVRGHLAEAVAQLPSAGRGAIHVGIETPDGEDVEAERYARIMNTAAIFDARGKNLRWGYTHLYESYAPPRHILVLRRDHLQDCGQ